MNILLYDHKLRARFSKGLSSQQLPLWHLWPDFQNSHAVNVLNFFQNLHTFFVSKWELPYFENLAQVLGALFFWKCGPNPESIEINRNVSLTSLSFGFGPRFWYLDLDSAGLLDLQKSHQAATLWGQLINGREKLGTARLPKVQNSQELFGVLECVCSRVTVLDEY